MGTPPCFFTIFTKGHKIYDFLFGSLNDIALPSKMGSIRKEMAPGGNIPWRVVPYAGEAKRKK